MWHVRITWSISSTGVNASSPISIVVQQQSDSNGCEGLSVLLEPESQSSGSGGNTSDKYRICDGKSLRFFLKLEELPLRK